MVPNELVLLIVAVLISFTMAMGIGANDVSNSVGTAVGAKAITIRQALLIAVVFEILGAVFAGGEVSSTIADKLYLPYVFETQNHKVVLIMLASLLSAGTWLMIATYYAWPVSTTHTLLGALIVLGSLILGPRAMNWEKVASIGLAWIVSPLAGGILSFCLIKLIQLGIVHQHNCAKRFFVYLTLPFLMINMIWALTVVNIMTSLLQLDLSPSMFLMIPIIVSIICYAMFFAFFFPKYKHLFLDRVIAPDHLDLAFNSLMMVTACCLAYAHGSNDISNAIGPLMSINQIIYKLPLQTTMPWWILLIGLSGMIIGLLVWGHRVIQTIGNHITDLTASKGFSASLATAFTVLMSSHLGYPISTTHTLVGAVLGVGLSRGVHAINLNIIKKILLSWAVTIPAGGMIAIIYYGVLKYVLAPYLLLTF